MGMQHGRQEKRRRASGRLLKEPEEACGRGRAVINEKEFRHTNQTQIYSSIAMSSPSDDAADTRLDVRPIEPKHRFEKIMGAYHGLSPGETLELVVDHDPKCMYYTLEAEHGAETFSFEYLDDGPTMWRVHVEKEESLEPAAAPAEE